MSNKEKKGLEEKYTVTRNDDNDKPAAYFVLDYKNDPYARKALGHYAEVCYESNPKLSSDIWIALRDEWIPLDKV